MRRLARSGMAALVLTLPLAGCEARPRTWSPQPPEVRATSATKGATETGAEVAELDLSRGAPESAARGLFAGATSPTFFQLVNVVRGITADDDSKAVFVRFGAARLGWSRAQELGALLAKLRAAGKPVVCHADGYTNSTAWVAAQGCQRIWVSPAGEVETVGIAAQVVYMHKLLAEKLGVSVDFLQMGKYKGAEEPLTRDGPSPEARASLESTLGEIRAQWIEGFRAKKPELEAAAEDGPFGPEEAKRRGLVDEVGYLDDAREDAKKLASAEHVDVRFGPSARAHAGGDLVELVRVLAGGGTGRGGAPHVSVLRAVGSIAMERGGGLFGGGAGITEKELGRTIRALAEDSSTKAVVLRIDSPGGSALASDLLWHELMKLRAKKPIVVSVGDMAASGGYYLASTGNKIVAEPTSIVGSIGVVGGKLAFGGTLEQLGVHAETFSAKGTPEAANRAAVESPLVAWDDATRERVRASMKAIYDLFLSRVAEGRGVPVEQIAQSAEGRIFAGHEAKNRGLVDEWGGIERAVALARELGKLGPDAPAKVVGDKSGLIELLDLDSDAGDDDDESALSRAATHAVPSPLAWTEEQLPGLGTFAGSLSPLLAGERALVAVPYGVIVR